MVSRESDSIPESPPSPSVRRVFTTRRSASEHRNVPEASSAWSMILRPLRTTSMPTVRFPRSHADGNSGGRTTDNSTGTAPGTASVVNCRPFGGAAGSGTAAGTAGEIAGAGESPADAGRNRARPTASEWAQMVPHCRDVRQVQRFSMFDLETIFSPARSS